MWQYTIKRLIQGVITVWFIATATFFAMHNVPGDPLINDRSVTDVFERGEQAGGSPLDTYGTPSGYNQPRRIRLSANWAFE